MNNLILKLHILSRAEMALLKIQLQRSSTRIMLYVVALVFALLALGMLNFAGYQALAETQTPAVAALLVALGDGFLALVIILISRGVGASEEQEKMVRDLRDLAYNELSADIDDVKDSVKQVTDDIGRIRSGFSTFTLGSGNLANSLGPIIGLLISALKKSKK